MSAHRTAYLLVVFGGINALGGSLAIAQCSRSGNSSNSAVNALQSNPMSASNFNARSSIASRGYPNSDPLTTYRQQQQQLLVAQQQAVAAAAMERAYRQQEQTLRIARNEQLRKLQAERKAERAIELAAKKSKRESQGFSSPSSAQVALR